MDKIFILLVLFQVKHFIADYPLQNAYMLGKTKLNGWVIPLALHALVHSVLTLIIILCVSPAFWWLSLVDFAVHFSVDRVKASPKMLNRFGIDNKFFWWALGADQMLHHLTHYAIIFCIIGAC